MRTLAKYLRNYKKESILAPFFKFLEVVFDLLVPIVIAQIIDVGIAHNDHGYIVQKFFILILMAAAGLAVSITAQFFAAKASVGFATEVRQAVFDHIQKLSYTELDTLGTDTLITRLTDDVNQVQNGVNMGLRLLLRSPFIVFGAMVMAFTINVRCALIFVVAIPVLFLVVFVIMFLSIPLFKKVQGRLDTVTRLTRENLTGVRVIRAFCREDHAVAEFDESNLALTKLNEFVGKISALLNPATYVLINIATVILIQTAGVQVNLGNMQQGEVVALYNYMAQMIVELIKLASLIITLNKSMACADRVAGILKVDSTMAYPEKTSAPVAAKNDCAVAFDHVTFSYDGKTDVLRDCSLSVKQGEKVALVGVSGAGKSTIIQLISRFYDTTKGEVRIGGRNVRDIRYEDLLAHISIVFQKTFLTRDSVLENIRMGTQATLEQVREAARLAQIDDFILSLPQGYDTKVGAMGSRFSGGERQRIAIARAILKDAPILILDEATSAADPENQVEIDRAIENLCRGKTVLIVAHRLGAVKMCDKVAVVEDHTITCCGTHAEVLEQNSYYRKAWADYRAARSITYSVKGGQDDDK